MQVNTFQCVVATDGDMTFTIFLYDQLEWSQGQNSSVARVGFYSGTEKDPWKMPCSGTQNITSLVNSSNIGENGIWLFRVDQDTIEPACTDKETCEEDMLCSCLTTNKESCLCDSTIRDGEELTCSSAEVEPSTRETPSIGPAERESDDCKSATVPILATLLGIAFVIALICMIIIIMLSWRLKVERKKS
ncbi:Alpha-tectorin [Geodia barretti]|uniref:Alpha-tectorin n=1 Tax=Geodia barretti TaxID=519541 RepID=A0AA35TBA7_GEOBA|nr:Alpha-tectorin [Geodia barretti]